MVRSLYQPKSHSARLVDGSEKSRLRAAPLIYPQLKEEWYTRQSLNRRLFCKVSVRGRDDAIIWCRDACPGIRQLSTSRLALACWFVLIEFFLRSNKRPSTLVPVSPEISHSGFIMPAGEPLDDVSRWMRWPECPQKPSDIALSTNNHEQDRVVIQWGSSFLESPRQCHFSVERCNGIAVLTTKSMTGRSLSLLFVSSCRNHEDEASVLARFVVIQILFSHHFSKRRPSHVTLSEIS